MAPRIDEGADGEPRRPGQLDPRHVLAGLEFLKHIEQLQKIDVVDRPGVGVIPIADLFPRHGHDIGHSQGTRRKDVRLEGQPVTVTTTDL
jgi:hypothetical protein